MRSRPRHLPDPFATNFRNNKASASRIPHDGEWFFNADQLMACDELEAVIAALIERKNADGPAWRSWDRHGLPFQAERSLATEQPHVLPWSGFHASRDQTGF